MDTTLKAGFIAGGAALLAGTVLMLSQTGKQGMTYETDLLNGAAAYVEQYDGSKPADALQYMLQTIDAVEESKNNVKGLSQLEKNVAEVRDEVIYLQDYRNPPTLYHAALEEAAGQARAVVRENKPSRAPTIAGAITFSAGVALLALSAVYAYRKKKTTP